MYDHLCVPADVWTSQLSAQSVHMQELNANKCISAWSPKLLQNEWFSNRHININSGDPTVPVHSSVTDELLLHVIYDIWYFALSDCSL